MRFESDRVSVSVDRCLHISAHIDSSCSPRRECHSARELTRSPLERALSSDINTVASALGTPAATRANVERSRTSALFAPFARQLLCLVALARVLEGSCARSTTAHRVHLASTTERRSVCSSAGIESRLAAQ